MRSLKTRITLLTVFAVAIAVAIVTTMSVVFIRNSTNIESEQMLLQLCETGERNLDYYFDSVQKSVEKIATNVEKDLNGLDSETLAAHVERMEEYFDEVAYKTNGVLTYYYRIDPEASDTVKGFWYTNLDGEGFKKHEVTDINLYDTQDTSQLVWFTVPKYEGKPVWLPPYVTDNLDVRVISYNVPIYWKGKFVGVVGIEIDYSTMAEQVESIKLFDHGYAFLNDDEGNLFYHPQIDVAQLTEKTKPPVPEGLISSSTFFNYTYDGVEKEAAWLPLNNGMRLTVSVPKSETDGDWTFLIRQILIVSVIVIIALSTLVMLYTRRITKPLEELTQAAEQLDRGNYDFNLNYNENDEVGRLTATFKRLASHMKNHIEDLNKRVFVDALTHAKNKGAFTDATGALQKQLDSDEPDPMFAIGVFDCDNLKLINDEFGHEKGDVYLKTACSLICQVYKHSPVFRTGGDEFAVILQRDDFKNREDLLSAFDKSCEEINSSAMNKWEQVHITSGFAVFDPQTDRNVTDTVRRADKVMYANKRKRKGIGR